MRKADKEGHSTDTIADCCFQLVLDVRFRRRGENQDDAAIAALKRVFETRGEVSLNSVILTAYHGYGRPSLMSEVRKLGLSSIFVMPNHMIRCHPYVAKSALNPARNDEQEQHGNGSTDDGNGAESALDRGEQVDETINGHMEADRTSSFIIDDDGAMDHCPYTAVGEVERGSQVLNACTVREPSGDKFCNVLRFMHELPPSVRSQFSAWVATPDPPPPLTFLFTDDNQDGGNDFKGGVESMLCELCHVLTIRQRTADWFILLQMRLTASPANGQMRYMSSFQVTAPPAPSNETAPTWQSRLSALTDSWFSRKRRTEGKMRGTSNETAAMSFLRQKHWVHSVYDVGMLCLRTNSTISVSPDGIVIMTAEYFEDLEWEGPGCLQVRDTKFPLAVVEIKTAVASRALGVQLLPVEEDIAYVTVGNTIISDFVPGELLAQILL